MKYYTFHCHSRGRGNYRVVKRGTSQSEAAGKIHAGERVARDLVCVSVSDTKREAEICQPRIR